MSFNLPLWLGQNGLQQAGPQLSTEVADFLAEELAATSPHFKKAFLFFVAARFVGTVCGEEVAAELAEDWPAETLVAITAAVWKKLAPANRAAVRHRGPKGRGCKGASSRQPRPRSAPNRPHSTAREHPAGRTIGHNGATHNGTAGTPTPTGADQHGTTTTHENRDKPRPS